VGDLLVTGGRIVPMAGGVRRGERAAALEVVEGGAVAIADGRVAFVGPEAAVPARLRTLPRLQAGGRVVLPGLVDCHTHVPFAGWRADEYAARLGGATYAGQQAAEERPRGIPRSAAQLAAAADATAVGFSGRRLAEALLAGTTTIELKSGYGMTVDGELRQLALMAQLRDKTVQRLVRTGLFLHAVPAGVDRAAYVDRAVNELLPRAVAGSAIEAVDAFVESIAFTLAEAARLIEAGQRAGLVTHLHAEQLAPSGAAAWAAARGVTSVDHLDHLDPAGVRALGGAPTVAVLLPGATFLAGDRGPGVARDLLAAGAAVAIATDLNPGTAPVSSLPEAAALACRMWDLRIPEAIAAVTVNAAAALGLSGEVGALERGARGDLVILDGDDPALLAYRLGAAAVDTVVVGGEVVFTFGGAKAS